MLTRLGPPDPRDILVRDDEAAAQGFKRLFAENPSELPRGEGSLPQRLVGASRDPLALDAFGVATTLAKELQGLCKVLVVSFTRKAPIRGAAAPLLGRGRPVAATAAWMSSSARDGYSVTIPSGESPSARLSRTTETMMRVPLIHGLPWQMARFASIRSFQFLITRPPPPQSDAPILAARLLSPPASTAAQVIHGSVGLHRRVSVSAVDGENAGPCHCLRPHLAESGRNDGSQEIFGSGPNARLLQRKMIRT